LRKDPHVDFRIPIRIWIGIKMDIGIGIRIGIKTMPSQKNTDFVTAMIPLLAYRTNV
jgi:hypothetical protein